MKSTNVVKGLLAAILLCTTFAHGYAQTRTDTEIVYDKPPAITDLPFGPKNVRSWKQLCDAHSKFYYDLIGRNYSVPNDAFASYTRTYALPPTDAYRYTVIDTATERSRCEGGGMTVDSLISIRKFKLRLPDYKGFEVYYMSNDGTHNDFPEAFKLLCGNFYYKLYGLLIFYKRDQRVAHLLPVFYDYFAESAKIRLFFIDRDYSVYVGDNGYTDGDVDVDEQGREIAQGVDRWTGPVRKKTIDSSGHFSIKVMGE